MFVYLKLFYIIVWDLRPLRGQCGSRDDVLRNAIPFTGSWGDGGAAAVADVTTEDGGESGKKKANSEAAPPAIIESDHVKDFTRANGSAKAGVSAAAGGFCNHWDQGFNGCQAVDTIAAYSSMAPYTCWQFQSHWGWLKKMIVFLNQCVSPVAPVFDV